jgi:hypothetical protein
VFSLGEKLNQKAIKTSIYIEDQAFGGIVNLQEKGRGHISLPLYFPFQIGWVFIMLADRPEIHSKVQLRMSHKSGKSCLK